MKIKTIFTLFLIINLIFFTHIINIKADIDKSKINTNEQKILEINKNYKVQIYYPITKYKTLNNNVNKQITNYLKEFKNNIKSSTIPINQYYYLIILYEKYEYKNYISFVFHIEDFTGGAHPNHRIYTVVYDIKEDKTTTKEETKTKKDNKNKVSYYCESGYVLNGTKCTKTETKNATGVCPQGYSARAWDNDYCTTEIDPEEEYRCIDKNGYKASDAVLDSVTNDCYYKKDYPESNPIYCSNHGRVYYNGYCYYAKFKAEFITYCAGGVNVNSSGMCDLRMNKVFNCENGWTLENKKCTKTIVVDAKKR